MCDVVVAAVTTAVHAVPVPLYHAAVAAQSLAVGVGLLPAATSVRSVGRVAVVHLPIPAADLSLIVKRVVATAVSGGCLAIDDQAATAAAAQLGHVVVRRASTAGGRACVAVLNALATAHLRTIVVRLGPAAARVTRVRVDLIMAAHLLVVVVFFSAAAAGAPALVLARFAPAAHHALSLAGRQCSVAAELMSVVVGLITTAAQIIRSTA